MAKKMLVGLLIWSLSVLAEPLSFAQAQRADYSCAGGAVNDWYGFSIKIKVLSGCVSATGAAENIRSSGAIVYFDLVPDAVSRRLMNAHNAYFGGAITVYVYGRRRIHGRLRDGARVHVMAPWVHDPTNGPNDLPAAHAVDVLPKAPARH